MGLHFSGHILFPVFIFAQLYIRWLDAIIKGRISTRNMKQVRWIVQMFGKMILKPRVV